MTIKTVLGMVAAMPLAVGAGAHAGAEPDQKIVFKTIGNTKLQLHVFTPKVHKPEDKRACVVFFFGGGWEGGTPTQFYEQCRYFASRGMVAVSAEYRVRSQHGTTPYECVADGKSAIRWLRQHAKEVGVDPERIAAGGGSAGGHVAAATAMTKAFDEPAEDLKISSKPNALVLFNPVIDNSPGVSGHEKVKDRWKEISPMHNIEKGAPPTIVFLGSKDSIIPVATLKEFKKRMVEAGSRCDAWIYEGKSHGFFNHGDNGNPCYDSTVFKADKFLSSLKCLEGEPTLKDTQVKVTEL